MKEGGDDHEEMKNLVVAKYAWKRIRLFKSVNDGPKAVDHSSDNDIDQIKSRQSVFHFWKIGEG